ncbi:hypothetical protein BC829DRAFT_383140 [Chytridium lagenaria]|nr:hypothetical protein BC829DRAFT_383140 [Chytridium lagenaria]
MGKDTDKTQSEWTQLDFGHGGYKARKTGKEFKRLPFSCCALSLTPFENPRCTKEGHIFDLVHILPWLKKYGTNPVTGEKLSSKDLIALHFHKNMFSESTRIVAVGTTGNVYAADTISELNYKTKNLRDLMTDEPFYKKDIITIQVNEIQPEKPPETAAEARKKQISSTINAKGATARILSALGAEKAEKTTPETTPTLTPAYIEKKTKGYNEAHFSYNAAAAAFTSMGATVVTENSRARYTDEAFLFMNVKGKAYAKIKTNLGDVNVELYCGDTPKTCYNFIMLAKSGFYKDVSFHRSIRNFMIQGDEIKPNLSHKEKGILSMANKGKNTNNSQFFITYRACTHLDKKHSVFGKVVGGLDVISAMEKIPTDDDDKPKEKITMLDVEILGSNAKKQKVENIPAPAPTQPGEGIGRYLDTSSVAGVKRNTEITDNVPDRSEPKKRGKSGFGDFSSW